MHGLSAGWCSGAVRGGHRCVTPASRDTAPGRWRRGQREVWGVAGDEHVVRGGAVRVRRRGPRTRVGQQAWVRHDRQPRGLLCDGVVAVRRRVTAHALHNLLVLLLQVCVNSSSTVTTDTWVWINRELNKSIKYLKCNSYYGIHQAYLIY